MAQRPFDPEEYDDINALPPYKLIRIALDVFYLHSRTPYVTDPVSKWVKSKGRKVIYKPRWGGTAIGKSEPSVGRLTR